MHDTRLAASTGELKSTYEKLEAPAMMAELAQREEAFAAAETRALVEQGVAARNEVVINLIRTPPLREGRLPGQRTGREIFRSDVDRRLVKLIGSGSLDARTMQMMLNAPEQMRDWTTARALVASQLAEEVAGFVSARDAANASLPAGADRDQRKTDCPSVLKVLPMDSGGSAVEQRYRILFRSCRQLQTMTEDLAATSDGIAARATPGSRLGSALLELAQLRGVKEKGEAQAKQLNAQLQEIDKKSKTATSVQALDEEIKKFREALEKAQPIGKQAGLEGLSRFIEELLAAELKQEEGTVPTPTTVRAAAALQALRAAARAKDTFAAQPRFARTNELLLAAARTRHELRMVQLDLARDESLRQNLEAQVNLLLIQAARLAEVRDFLKEVRVDDVATARASSNDSIRTAAGQALASYLSAWNEGEIPYNALRFRDLQIRRTAALERAKLTEADYRVSLKPVFDELAAYGEGGVKAETIAEFLGHLGVAGSILGN
ncbi:MAG TPA: hypothetical protein VF782_09735 [Allosphingosinicella sp.]